MKTTHCMEREELFGLACHLLDAPAEAQARAHVSECEACREVVESYQRLEGVLEEWRPVEPTPWFDAKVRAAAASRRPARRPFFGFEWARWLSPAFVATMVVAGVLIVRNHARPPASIPKVEPSAAQAATTPLPGAAQATEADQELMLYRNLPVLEDYDVLSNLDVLSEFPKGAGKIAD
jgi:predicted anti-sigma-YlaC factor YlaD